MDAIRIDVGVYTSLRIDLSNYDFTGISKVVMTAKNKTNSSDIAFEREFTESQIYDIVVTPEESKRLRDGAIYDFNKITIDGKRYKIGENGKILVRVGCGQCQI